MTHVRSITLHKSIVTNTYIVTQAMTQEFYLLYLLVIQHDNSGKSLELFIKKSSVTSCITQHLFINKKGNTVELFDVHDLAQRDGLCLPAQAVISIPFHNFVKFIASKQQLILQNSQSIIIAVDDSGYIYATTDLQTIQQKPLYTRFLLNITHFLKKIKPINR